MLLHPVFASREFDREILACVSDLTLTDRFSHKRADLLLVCGGQLFQGEGHRPQIAVIDGRRVVEAECCVPSIELLRSLKEADDLALLIRIRGHPVPEFWRE